MSAVELPQSIPPSIAFEIPLEKKETKDSPPVQKRLEEAATTPRKSFSLHDIMRKLTDAGKRKEKVSSATKSKLKSHHAAVKSNVESFAANSAAAELESQFVSKIDTASTRREDIVAKKVEKLAESNKDKLERGSIALNEAEAQSKLLDEQSRLKVETAALRHEQMLLSKVANLSITNDSKLKRAKLALELDGIEAQHRGNVSDQKLLSAAHRREMINIFKSIDNTELAANKEARAADAKHREEVLAATRAYSIEKKLREAEAKRAAATAETVKNLQAKNQDKIQRGAQKLKEQQLHSKETELESQRKLELANERRLRQIEEQRIASNTASTKKERQLKEMSALEEAELRVKDKALNAKLLAAEVRKEQMLLAKSTKLADRFEQLKMQSVMVMQSELEDAANLGKEVDKKLKTAHARKERKDKEMADALYAKSQAKTEKVSKLLSNQELHEIKTYQEMEIKIANANAKRQQKITESVTKSSSKKRMCSPKPSPTKGELEARINEAARRREMYILAKIDKATVSTSKKLSPRSDLFANTTPRLGDERTSPRIKAARLESAPDNKPEDEVFNQHFSMMPIIATSCIALALVGAFSFWKH
jgi:hypothetical protein